MIASNEDFHSGEKIGNWGRWARDLHGGGESSYFILLVMEAIYVLM